VRLRSSGRSYLGLPEREHFFNALVVDPGALIRGNDVVQGFER